MSDKNEPANQKPDFFDKVAQAILLGTHDALDGRAQSKRMVAGQKDNIAMFLRSTFDEPGAQKRGPLEGAQRFPDGGMVGAAVRPVKVRAAMFPDTATLERKVPAHLTAFCSEARLSDDSVIPGYLPLEMVLCAAYAQAGAGKGKERHAAGDDFTDQPILTIGRLLKSADGEAYQAFKKTREALMMHRRGQTDAAIREVLGAINYLAAVALLLAEEQHEKGVRDFADDFED